MATIFHRIRDWVFGDRLRLEEIRLHRRMLIEAARDESLSHEAVRNIVLMVLDPAPITEADIARGRELAEKYGWRVQP